MRIVVSTNNYEILNSIIRAAKEHGNKILIAKLEKALFEYIEGEEEDEIDAYIISANSSFAQKAVDYIKKEFPYKPVIIIGDSKKYSVISSDIIIPYEDSINTEFYAESVLHNIYVFNKNFQKLQKLTAKIGQVIEFGECKYDSAKRILSYKGKDVHKLSPKQAGIFELLALNFQEVVLKETILEKVWHDSNYFVKRSLDVFVTHLRKILEQNNVNMAIESVSNMGLVLDYKNDKI